MVAILSVNRRRGRGSTKALLTILLTKIVPERRSRLGYGWTLIESGGLSSGGKNCKRTKSTPYPGIDGRFDADLCKHEATTRKQIALRAYER